MQLLAHIWSTLERLKCLMQKKLAMWQLSRQKISGQKSSAKILSSGNFGLQKTGLGCIRTTDFCLCNHVCYLYTDVRIDALILYEQK